jgi:hypothetical protein
VRIEIGAGVLYLIELLDARHHQRRLRVRHQRFDKAPPRMGPASDLHDAVRPIGTFAPSGG